MRPIRGDFFVVTNQPSNLIYKILFDLTTWGTASPVVHSGIYVGHAFGHQEPQVIEARPGGVGFAPYSKYQEAQWSSNKLALTRDQRNQIVEYAGKCIGVPYDNMALVVAAFAQKKLGQFVSPYRPLHEQPKWVRRLIHQNRVICSSMVALAYEYAEAALINGYLPWIISSGDLMRVIGDINEDNLAQREREAIIGNTKSWSNRRRRFSRLRS
jgi:hypothetical protein